MTPDAEKALNMVMHAPKLVVDTETSGLFWTRNYPVGYVFTVGRDSLYIPVRHGGGGNLPCLSLGSHVQAEAEVPDAGSLPNHSFENALKDAMEKRHKTMPDALIIGHNLKFDCHFFAQRGIMLGRSLTCTQNNQTLIDEYSPSYSLSALSARYGVEAKKGEELYEYLATLFGVPANKNAMAHYWRLSGNDPIGVEYAVVDGISTWELHERQQEILDDEGVGKEVRRVENELIWTLVRMEQRGMRVDLKYLKKLKAEINQKVEDAYKRLPKDFNVRSPLDMKGLMTKHGHTDWPTTPKGNPSFTEKWLKNHDIGRTILEIRKMSNLNNTFVVPLMETHQHKGRVHPTINQNKADDYGTTSGRLSCTAPNMQQAPKHNKEIAKLFRKAFIPDTGYEIFEADWSQCEPRLFAHYSKEPALVDGYSRTPFRDVHTVVAELFNADRNTTAKRMNMGMFTGMFPPTFAEHMGVSLAEATELWNKWFDNFPGIKGFQDMARMVILKRGHVRTLLGRHGHLENKRLAYKATSKIIQGGNADILKYKMVEIDRHFEKQGDTSHLLMTVHDSFIWQSPKGKRAKATAKEVVDIMVDVQGEPFNLRVPFAADLGGGRNWSEASFGE